MRRSVPVWVACVASAVLGAQADPLSDQFVDARARTMLGQLELRPDQRVAAESDLVEGLRRQLEILTRHAEDTRRGVVDRLESAVRDVQAETRNRLAGVLEPDQQSVLAGLQKRQLADLAGEWAVVGLDGRLGLSVDQRARLIPIFSRHIDQRRTLLAEGEAQSEYQATRRHRAQLQALERELDAQIEPLLDEDQMAEFRLYRVEALDRMRRRMRKQRGSPRGTEG